MSKNFRKWTDLNQFHEVTRNLNYPRIHDIVVKNDYKIPYSFKIKLHGTNACVRIEQDGNVVPQKRSSDIGPVKKMDGVTKLRDNAGFAAWTKKEEGYWSTLAKSDRILYVYGEWVGNGVQSGVACSQLDTKRFFVFAIDGVKDDGNIERIVDPHVIEAILFGHGKESDTVHVIPWHSHATMNFMNKEATSQTIEKLNDTVEKIGELDPLMMEMFEIKGSGEGLVGYPALGENRGISYKNDDLQLFSWFNFKAKSEHHRVNAHKKSVQFDPDKYANIQIFADTYCTEARFLQAFKDGVGEEKNLRRIPDFIKWVVSDIHKETTTEREANPDLDWKAISKACSTRAVSWYKDKVKEL